MIFFPRYYIAIYNGITDAIEALRDHRPDDALEILCKTQMEADEIFMDDSEDVHEAFLRGSGRKE